MTKPMDMRLTKLKMMAMEKLATFTFSLRDPYDLPTSTRSVRLSAVMTSFTRTCAVRMVYGRRGVARRRLSMPPSR